MCSFLFLLVELFSQPPFSLFGGFLIAHLEKGVLINVKVVSVALDVLAVLGHALHLHEETTSTAWEGRLLDGGFRLERVVPLAVDAIASHRLDGEQVPDCKHLVS